MLTLLKLLKDGRFHSGQALGVALGISRSAVWKQLQHLEAELGLSIHKVRGRGYQLAAPLTLLDPVEIGEQAPSCDWPILVFDSIDSTNAEALRAIERGQAAPFLVLAERQTAGRGRRGRKWVSPFAENIYYSLVLRIEGGMRQLEGLESCCWACCHAGLARAWCFGGWIEVAQRCSGWSEEDRRDIARAGGGSC